MNFELHEFLENDWRNIRHIQSREEPKVFLNLSATVGKLYYVIWVCFLDQYSKNWMPVMFVPLKLYQWIKLCLKVRNSIVGLFGSWKYSISKSKILTDFRNSWDFAWKIGTLYFSHATKRGCILLFQPMRILITWRFTSKYRLFASLAPLWMEFCLELMMGWSPHFKESSDWMMATIFFIHSIQNTDQLPSIWLTIKGLFSSNLEDYAGIHIIHPYFSFRTWKFLSQK